MPLIPVWTQKYQILTSELHHPVNSFDEKLYIFETCYEHLHKKESPCQAVCNKMALDELNDLEKKLQNVLIFKRICLRK